MELGEFLLVGVCDEPVRPTALPAGGDPAAVDPGIKNGGVHAQLGRQVLEPPLGAGVDVLEWCSLAILQLGGYAPNQWLCHPLPLGGIALQVCIPPTQQPAGSEDRDRWGAALAVVAVVTQATGKTRFRARHARSDFAPRQ